VARHKSLSEYYTVKLEISLQECRSVVARGTREDRTRREVARCAVRVSEVRDLGVDPIKLNARDLSIILSHCTYCI
jgi:hypothetical protein